MTRSRFCVAESNATFPSSAVPCVLKNLFLLPFSHAKFLAATTNLSSSTATGPDKVAYPMQKHLPRSGMDFLLHILIFPVICNPFFSIWKASSIIPIHKMAKPLDSVVSLRLISLTSAYQSFLSVSVYHVYSSF